MAKVCCLNVSNLNALKGSSFPCKSVLLQISVATNYQSAVSYLVLSRIIAHFKSVQFDNFAIHICL